MSLVLDYRRILEDVDVPKHLVEDCMEWAFGSDWKNLSPYKESQIRWNQRHGDIFKIRPTDLIVDALKVIGTAFMAQKKGQFINVASLWDLNQSEKKFRSVIIKTFTKQGMTNINEMMDCISWGLNYNDDLLRCHSYSKWPEEFRINTGINVHPTDTIEKCIFLLAEKWKSKPKFFTPGGLCQTSKN